MRSIYIIGKIIATYLCILITVVIVSTEIRIYLWMIITHDIIAKDFGGLINW